MRHRGIKDLVIKFSVVVPHNCQQSALRAWGIQLYHPLFYSHTNHFRHEMRICQWLALTPGLDGKGLLNKSAAPSSVGGHALHSAFCLFCAVASHRGFAIKDSHWRRVLPALATDGQAFSLRSKAE